MEAIAYKKFTARNFLLAERSRKRGLGGIHWGERGLRGREELRWWFGCCGDFGRKISQSKPQLLKTCSSGQNFPIQNHEFPDRFAKVFLGSGLSFDWGGILFGW
ncbi:MAG TPA: hypothetical protein DDW68_07755 [Verrucomicrobiales bacterium]|nr:hypothetical protein [Verrucomicrobiales bacterium]